MIQGPDVYIDISRSFVQCNLTPNAKDGTFKVVAASFSAFDQTFYEEANLFANLTPYDGAVLQLQALADTNLAYAQPFAVAAITDQGLQQSSSMYAPGYPCLRWSARLRRVAPPPTSIPSTRSGT